MLSKLNGQIYSDFHLVLPASGPSYIIKVMDFNFDRSKDIHLHRPDFDHVEGRLDLSEVVDPSTIDPSVLEYIDAVAAQFVERQMRDKDRFDELSAEMSD